MTSENGSITDDAIRSLVGLDRDRLRNLWERAERGDVSELDAVERKTVFVMMDHREEYGGLFETSEDDQTADAAVDPYLHVAIHQVVESQIENRSPMEAFEFFNALRDRDCSRHEALHLTMAVFTRFLFDAVHASRLFDAEGYARMLRSLRGHDPVRIREIVEQVFIDAEDPTDDL